MSYILEALRKAERERNAGQAPDLQMGSRSDLQPPKLALTRQWLILGAAIFAGLCIGVGLWLKPARGPEPATQTAVLAEPAHAEPMPTNEPETAEITAGAERLDDLLDNEPIALPIEEQQKLSAVPSPAPKIRPIESNPVATENPATSSLAQEPTQAEQALAEPELPPELKKLKEMTTEYRNDFPPIRIDVHAYDEQPAKRFVMINGRRYHEGEVLTEGPRIVSIEEDGIVFNYRNEEVLYPIAR